MKIHRIPAIFMRGGTSKAVMFRSEHLPADRAEWDAIFLAAMGSPDPYGRQLDGMGGGLSSLSKICVVGPPTRPDADVDYTFVQISVDAPIADYSGNCGNMSAAIGPFAIEEGIIPAPLDGEAVVRIHNTNTSKIIAARFPVKDGALMPDGAMSLDGVAGTAAPIRLEFLDPGGAKTGRLLPTGRPADRLDISGREIEASLIDAANPCVFVNAADVGKIGVETPGDLEKDAVWLATMEEIRLAASVAMGLAPDIAAARAIPSIPKVAMLALPQSSRTLSGEIASAEDVDIVIRMISVGQPHRAVPITGSVCLAVAARIPGTIAQALCRASAGPIRIGHASGTTMVDALVEEREAGMHADHGAVFRSARRLFEGNVLYRA